MLCPQCGGMVGSLAEVPSVPRRWSRGKFLRAILVSLLLAGLISGSVARFIGPAFDRPEDRIILWVLVGWMFVSWFFTFACIQLLPRTER
jgi:hypothetical protein